MKYRTLLSALHLVAALATAERALAQRPLRDGADVPPGHPQVAQGAAPSAAPAPKSSAMAPPVDPDAELPPGHPTTPSPEPAMPANHPEPGAASSGPPAADRVVEAPELGEGVVAVMIQGSDGKPLAGIDVTLRQHRHNIAEGDSFADLRLTTDASGEARFADLPVDTSYSFTAAVAHAGAKYRSQELQISDRKGRRVLLHVYPAVREINRVLVGMRGVVLMEPREDTLQVEMSFQVFNIGRSTWLPDATSFPLPPGAKAFRARESTTEAKVEQRDGRVHLAGSFPPGQQDLSFTFQLPASGEESQSFELELPPHVVELRVASAMGRSAALSVPGFEEARHVRGQDGAWLALTGRQLSTGEKPMERIQVQLSGLRVPSRGRWIAAGIAAGLAALGLGAAVSRRSGQPANRAAAEDTDRARELLFDELAALERLHREERIGPRAYERNRGLLIDALARLEAVRAGPGAPSHP